MYRICRMSGAKTAANHSVDPSFEGFAVELQITTANSPSCFGRRERRDAVCSAVGAGIARMNRIAVT